MKQIIRMGFRIGLGLAALMLLLSGCGPGQDELAGTIAVQVVAEAGQTAAAWPTFTSEPTLTPRPAHTAVPSPTPWPTLTPNPTLTPRPTLTPNPTYTAQPTPTGPATAAVIVQQAGQLTNSQPAPAGGGLVFDEFGIVAMRSGIDLVARYILPRDTGGQGLDYGQRYGTVQKEVACAELLEAYRILQSRRISRPANPSLQAAFDEYDAAIARFLGVVSGWIDACQAAGGQDLPTLSASDKTIVLNERDLAKARLQQAVNLLPGNY